MYNLKQMLVIRKDLGMRKGKIAAQAAHASVLITLGVKHLSEYTLQAWIAEGMPKICVSVDSEEELLRIVREAREAMLPCALVTDAGHTEFKGVPTKTCCAIGPAPSEQIDKITGDLILL
jgi:peptidyl-tRNA hydrolase, PTH2 family